MKVGTKIAMAGLLGLVGCDSDDERSQNSGTGLGTLTASGAGSGGQDSDDKPGGTSNGDDDDGGSGTDDAPDPSGDDAPKFDVGVPQATGADSDSCGTDCECTIPDHQPCDAATGDPFLAMGLGCPGEFAVQVSTSGSASAIGVRTSFGGNGTFTPREGSAYAVIGSGPTAQLDQQTPPGDSNAFPTFCNVEMNGNNVALPAPLRINDVGGDCTTDATLLGTGDCSNTIEGQYEQSPDGSFDYTELRFEADVPLDVVSLSYDFAFMSTEYPTYFGEEFNDMYVGWLESEQWTGNISFDANGNPISLNAGFLEFTDDAGNLPELAGTCMRQHAATGWLTSSAGVTPGEHITVVFGIFDLGDGALDSYAFLDNFQWGCDPGAPTTTPEG